MCPLRTSDFFARACRGESSAIHYAERFCRSTPSAIYSPDEARRDFFARGTPADEDGNAMRSFRKRPRQHLVHPYAAATFSQVASPHEVALGCSPCDFFATCSHTGSMPSMRAATFSLEACCGEGTRAPRANNSQSGSAGQPPRSSRCDFFARVCSSTGRRRSAVLTFSRRTLES